MLQQFSPTVICAMMKRMLMFIDCVQLYCYRYERASLLSFTWYLWCDVCLFSSCFAWLQQCNFHVVCKLLLNIKRAATNKGTTKWRSNIKKGIAINHQSVADSPNRFFAQPVNCLLNEKKRMSEWMNIFLCEQLHTLVFLLF